MASFLVHAQAMNEMPKSFVAFEAELAKATAPGYGRGYLRRHRTALCKHPRPLSAELPLWPTMDWPPRQKSLAAALRHPGAAPHTCSLGYDQI